MFLFSFGGGKSRDLALRRGRRDASDGAASDASSVAPLERMLLDALLEGSYADLAEALTSGGDPNTRDEEGSCLLHLACLNHRADMVALLLDAKGDPASTAVGDATPLHAASEIGATSCVSLLLEGNAATDMRAAEEAMCRVMGEKDQKAAVKVKEQEMYRGKIVTAAIGQRVMVEGVKRGESVVVRGLYQMNGRIMEDDTKRVLNPPDFAGLALVGEAARRFFIAIKLESDPETSLQALADAHGTTHGREKAANTQADPHCTCCGGGESTEGNEILLCDGLNCANNYHQRCCNPPVAAVPEGAWLCPSCVARGNEIDPEVDEDEQQRKDTEGGVEQIMVARNDGSGDQDIELMMEVVECVDSSLPLIGRANAAKLVFAPDHQSLVLLRRNELPSGAVVRRVLGALVVKPHLARGFLEIAYCVVRKEEQRNGIGSRLISELKKHAVSIGVLHLLTYADDSATGFFERLGFDANAEANGMELNRFHWGISHYTGSQLRQCALDPDGVTLYPPSYPRRTPHFGRRLFHRPPAAAAPPAAAEAGGTSGAAEGEQ